MSRTLERVMAITWEEFQRILPAAVGNLPFEVGRRRATVRLNGDEEVEIALGETGERKIALIRLPATPVTIRYDGSRDAEFALFLDRFDRYFQRGGG